MNTAVTLKPLFVDFPTALAVVALSESTVQALIRAGEFPKPRQLSPKRVGYLVSELEAWAADRPVSNLPPPSNTGRRKKGDTE
jgi:prophage regulatory protein